MERSGSSAPFVLCQDLVRIFAVDGIEVQALQGLNLRVEAGELVAIVGASGSGKSTLLQILSGLDRPTGGSARVGETDLIAMRGPERVRYQRHVVGFIWQQTSRNLLPYLSIAQNIELPLQLAGVRSGTRRRRVAELVELFELGDLADRAPLALSGGQQQRAAIAVANANEPRLLLADEPTGELDEEASEAVLTAMERANAELGVTVIIVTHDPAVATHVNRTIRIRDGRTATEVLRRTEIGQDGVASRVHEEYAVLDRSGRLQLPQEYVETLGLADRVRLDLAPDHVEVYPGSER